MKKNFVIASGLAVILSGAAVTTLFALNKPDSQQQNTQQVAVSKAPQEQQKESIVNEPTQVVEKPQEAPKQAVEQSIPTNDELATQYGWDRMAGGANNYINRWPQYFTETERGRSFQYMRSVGVALAKMLSPEIAALPDDQVNNITANGAFLNFMRPYFTSSDGSGWVELGKRAGVDTSYYE